MNVYTDILRIKGSEPGPENPLPMFRSPESRKPLSHDDSFTGADRQLFGYETGFRIMPYLMQDSYGRERRDLELKTAVLENDRLKAVFLPDYGGRLVSLTEKKSGRELLFRNPVFQPANLGQRDAWFSGGIEWNIGRFGHTVFTCSPLFFAELEDDEGNSFLRAWEYERVNRTFFQMDFHLPEGAMQLAVHVRIVNDNTEEIPMYWWTNTAVPEDRKLRILSSTEDVIYIKPESNLSEGSVHEFSRAKLQSLPTMSGKDPSYPREFEYSSEYFFQTASDCPSPWEAAVYDDGLTFFDRSTAELRYRKMFCWGTHRGGRNWCDYLSEAGLGDYVEIQAGLAPTQVHGLRMGGGSEWSFTQFFGAFQGETAELSGSWASACGYAEAAIDRLLPPSRVAELDRKFKRLSRKTPSEILHHGSGWGALEAARRWADGDARPIPEGMRFPKESLTEKQQRWLSLLDSNRLPSPPHVYPTSWMTDPAWEIRLKKASSDGTIEERLWALIHLGALYYETGRADDALGCWTESLELEPTSIALRNIGIFYRDNKLHEKAAGAFAEAAALEGGGISEPLAREVINQYCLSGRFTDAWDFYSGLSEKLRGAEKIAVAAAEAASELGHDDFLMRLFNRSFAYIKEGETRLVEYWYRMHARKIATERGADDCRQFMDDAKNRYPPPRQIDFMMA